MWKGILLCCSLTIRLERPPRSDSVSTYITSLGNNTDTIGLEAKPLTGSLYFNPLLGSYYIRHQAVDYARVNLGWLHY